MVLSYRHPSYEGSRTDQGYAVRLERTSCHYGGTRAWFLCPTKDCGKRVAILYLGGAIFACRHCYRLGYQSQREAPYMRAISRAKVIRIRLRGSANLNEPFPWKPERMRLSTYRLWCAKSACDKDSPLRQSSILASQIPVRHRGAKFILTSTAING